MNSQRISRPNNCPGEAVLQQYLDDELDLVEIDTIEDHLAACERCFSMLVVLEPSISASTHNDETESSDVPAGTSVPEFVLRHSHELRERTEAIERNVKPLSEVLQTQGFRIGQVWRPKLDQILVATHDGKEYHSFEDFGSVPKLAVITNSRTAEHFGHEVVRVAPIHPKIGLETDEDLFVDIAATPVGYPFYIQGWNQVDVLLENLDSCIGAIEFAGETELLSQLAEIGSVNSISPIAITVAGESLQLPFAGIESDTFPKSIDTDPVARFRYRQFQEAAFLRVPGELLKEADALTSKFPVKENGVSSLSNFFGNFAGIGRIASFAAPVVLLAALSAGFIYYVGWFRSSPELTNNPEIETPSNESPDTNRRLNSNGGNSPEEDRKEVPSIRNTNSSQIEGSKPPVGPLINPTEERRQRPSSRPRDSHRAAPYPSSPPARFAKNDSQRTPPRPSPYEAVTGSTWTPGQFEPGINIPRKDRSANDRSRGSMVATANGRHGRDTKVHTANEYSGKFLRPNGAYVRTLTPTLSWALISGADSYVVNVYDSKFVRLNGIVSGADDGRIKGDSVAITKPLGSGTLYHWTLTPYSADGRPILLENQELGASFRTLTDVQSQRIALAESNVTSGSKPSLKLATVYLNHALYDDAMLELEGYLRVHPRSRRARRMLEYARNQGGQNER